MTASRILGGLAMLAVSTCHADDVCSAAAPPVTALCFAPDGHSVVIGSQSGIEVRPWPQLEPARTILTKLAHVHDLAFAPDGERLAAAGGAPGESGDVEVFAWPDGKSLQLLRPHEDLAYGVAWDLDGKRLLTASADKSGAAIILAGEGRVTFSGHSRGVAALVALPDGETAVSAGADQSLRVWKLASGESVRRLDNHTAAIHDLAVRPGRPDEPTVVASAGADRTLRLWQVSIGRMLRYARLPAEPLAIAFTPDAKLLVAACSDGRLRQFNATSLKSLDDRPAVDGWAYSVAVSPDGEDVLVGGERGQLKRLSLRAAAP